jgi:DNA-binding XRE family transcriptional regulator
LGNIVLDENSALGIHIRKKRLELKMNQEDAAKILNVTEACIVLWENLHAKPQIHNIPFITAFLGYCPITYDCVSIAGRIKAYRILNGLSCESFGKKLGVLGGAVSYWENGGNPKPMTLKEVIRIVGEEDEIPREKIQLN